MHVLNSYQFVWILISIHLNSERLIAMEITSYWWNGNIENATLDSHKLNWNKSSLNEFVLTNWKGFFFLIMHGFIRIEDYGI